MATTHLLPLAQTLLHSVYTTWEPAVVAAAVATATVVTFLFVFVYFNPPNRRAEEKPRSPEQAWHRSPDPWLRADLVTTRESDVEQEGSGGEETEVADVTEDDAEDASPIVWRMRRRRRRHRVSTEPCFEGESQWFNAQVLRRCLGNDALLLRHIIWDGDREHSVAYATYTPEGRLGAVIHGDGTNTGKLWRSPCGMAGQHRHKVMKTRGKSHALGWYEVEACVNRGVPCREQWRFLEDIAPLQGLRGEALIAVRQEMNNERANGRN
jgi:hypothetical protein